MGIFSRRPSLRKYFMSGVDFIPRVLQPYILEKDIRSSGICSDFRVSLYHSKTFMLTNITMPDNSVLQIFYSPEFYLNGNGDSPFRIDVRIVGRGGKVLKEYSNVFTIRDFDGADIVCHQIVGLMKDHLNSLS